MYFSHAPPVQTPVQYILTGLDSEQTNSSICDNVTETLVSDYHYLNLDENFSIDEDFSSTLSYQDGDMSMHLSFFTQFSGESSLPDIVEYREWNNFQPCGTPAWCEEYQVYDRPHQSEDPLNVITGQYLGPNYLH